MDESILKSHFIGRDGFRWWIGQIPPIKDQGSQHSGAGWGNRFKVRIMGYHPPNEQELSNEDLPWAQVLLPATAGTGSGNHSSSVMLSQGDVVFGFFLDGDNAQIPVIMGAFGKTSAVSTGEYSLPFVPFTGYTSNIKKPAKSVLKADQSGDQNAGSQESPIHVSPSQAAPLDKVSYSSVIGSTVRLGNASAGSTISKINTEINNILNYVQNISVIISDGGDYLNRIISFEIDRVTQKIKDIVSGMVNGMVNGLYKKLAPLINQGLKLLYELVYNLVLAATQNPAIAHLAGVAAQKAMVFPVKAIADLIPSIANTIIDGLGGLIKGILTSAVSNVTNFTSCVANQFTGVLTNSIIGQVSGGLSSAIGAIGPITQFFGGFSVEGTMRSGSEILGSFGQLVNAGQSASNFESSVNEWVIGRGPKNARVPNFSDIIRTANDAAALATSAFSNTSNDTQNNKVSTNKGAVRNIAIVSKGSNFNITNGIQTYPIGGNGTGLTLNILETSGEKSLINKVEIFNPGTGYQNGDIIEVISPGGGENALFVISSVEKSTTNFTPTGSQNSLISNFNNFTIFSSDFNNRECYSGPPLSCGAPVINIFGSNGSGATAIPILGNIVGDERDRRGSVIGVRLTNPGSGYDFPPFVEIVDECNRGYGAIARAVLDGEGRIDYIYIVSEGEGYPIGELDEYVVTGVNVLNPGSGYEDGDIVVDNLGNQYSTKVINGSLVQVNPLNTIAVTELPVLTVISADGSGALLTPTIDTRTEFQGEVKQVIDCITK